MLARAAAARPCRASAPVRAPARAAASSRSFSTAAPRRAPAAALPPRPLVPIVPRASFHAPRMEVRSPSETLTVKRAGFGVVGAALLLGAAAYMLNDDDKAQAAEKFTGVPGTDGERTFIAIKPDGVQRGLIGEIVARFEKKGYKLVAAKVVQPSEAFAREHYSDLAQKPFFPSLVKYFSSGPVFAMVWEGKSAISMGRKLIGATNPANAEPGSIRGDLCIETGRNIVRHLSFIWNSRNQSQEL